MKREKDNEEVGKWREGFELHLLTLYDVMIESKNYLKGDSGLSWNNRRRGIDSRRNRLNNRDKFSLAYLSLGGQLFKDGIFIGSMCQEGIDLRGIDSR